MSRSMSCAAALFTVAMAGLVHADSSVSWQKAPEGTFEVNDFVLARGVGEDRKPVDPSDGDSIKIDADGKRLYAYLSVFNKGAPRSLKVVWKRGEKTYHQATLVVKRSPTWRTWAFIDARPSLKGTWSVSILDDSDKVLATRTFTLD